MNLMQISSFYQGYTNNEFGEFSNPYLNLMFGNIYSSHLPEDKEYIKISQASIPRIQQISKSQLSTLIPGVQRKILYIPHQVCSNMEHTFTTKNFPPNYVLQEINRCARSIDCFDLPVKCNENETVSGVEECIFGLNSPEFIKAHPIINNRIVLAGNIDSTEVGTYLHEITHALTNRSKNIVKNFYDSEFLSIFMELLMTKEFESESELKRIQMNRWISLRDSLYYISINKPGFEDPKKYYRGFIMALSLLDLYTNMFDDEKTSLLNNLRKVINGILPLTTFLANYEIEFSNEESTNTASKSLILAEEYARSRH